MTNDDVWRRCQHHHHGCACHEHKWEEKVEALRGLLEELYAWADNWLPDDAKDQGAREVLAQVRITLGKE